MLQFGGNVSGGAELEAGLSEEGQFSARFKFAYGIRNEGGKGEGRGEATKVP